MAWNDFAINLIYLPMLGMNVGLIIDALRHRRHRHRTDNMLFVLFSLLGWQVTTIWYHYSRSLMVSRFLFDFRLPFVGLLSVAVLLFVIRFYNMDAYHTPALIACLLVVPAITLALSLTHNFHDYLRTSLVIITAYPHHTYEFGRGIWYWVHAVACYLEILYALLLALQQYRKIPKLYRAPSLVLLLGLLPSVAGNVMVLTDTLYVGLDYSLVGAGICAVLLYFTTAKKRGMDFLHRARSEILNELDEGVLALNDQGRTIGRNRAAKYLLYQHGLDPEESSYQTIIETMFSHAAQANFGGSDGASYHTVIDGSHRVLSVKEKAILDNKGARIGTISICADATESYNTIRHLEDEAGLDAMTGLLGRARMEEILAELSLPHHLPLAAIAGDLNNLKEVNDRLGHQQGDVLLRETADAMLISCPPRAHVARMGGDEFLILVPQCAAEQADSLMEEIRLRLEGARVRGSIALGADVRESAERPLEEVLRAADQNMYQDKRRYKERLSV